MPMDQMWQTMSLGMLIVWTLIVAAIVIGVVAVVRTVQGRGGGSPQDRSHAAALQILEERFARGEIDRDEFEERRRVVGS